VNAGMLALSNNEDDINQVFYHSLKILPLITMVGLVCIKLYIARAGPGYVILYYRHRPDAKIGYCIANYIDEKLAVYT